MDDQLRDVDEEDDDEEERNVNIAAAEERRLQYISILQRQGKFPLRQRNKLDTMIERDLEELGDDIHKMICDRNKDNYQGLDSSRDTKEEVETAVREYPEVLSRRQGGTVRWNGDEEEWFLDEEEHDNEVFVEGEYPIRVLLFMYGTGIHGPSLYLNLKAIPFISLLVRLGFELDQFLEEERGGLLYKDGFRNTYIQHLVRSSFLCLEEDYSQLVDNALLREHNQLVDNALLMQFIQLRQMGLFKKNDIRDCELVFDSIYEDDYFAVNRFRFLTEWDPTSLIQADVHTRGLPLHYAANKLDPTSIQSFQSVFKYGIFYYPYKKGLSLLFQKNEDGVTPFQLACINYGRDKVMKIVEDTLNNSDIQINTVDALFVAASDEQQHLDCVYLLLMRQPVMLVKLLSKLIDNNDGDDGHNEHDDDGNDDDDDDDLNDGNGNDTNNIVESYVDRKKDTNDSNHVEIGGGDSNDSIDDANSIGNSDYKKRKRE